MNMLVELLAIVILSFSSPVNCADECTPVNGMPPCVCEVSDKTRIDLRSISRSDGNPVFKDVPDDKSKNKYSYNPCYPFTEGECKDVAGCQINGDATRSTGTQEKAKFRNDDSGVSIYYDGGNGGRKMIVQLKCDKSKTSPLLEFSGENSDNEYTFILTTECACPGTCNGQSPQPASGQHSSSSSTIGIPGLIILSILVILIVVYFVAGMIIMRVKYEKTGSDIIPNKGFWFSLPSLVKDGCVFTFSPCCNYFQSKSKGYSNI